MPADCPYSEAMLGPGATASNLDSLVSRVWPDAADPTSPVLVTHGQLPPTHRLRDEYLVLPSRGTPALLVPAAAPAQALLLYSVAKGRTARAVGAAAGRTSWIGSRLARSRLRVGVDRQVPANAAVSLIDAIGAELGRDGLLACMPVRPSRPSAKPIVMLFDPADSTAVWAKVGWSSWTQRLVRDEHAALTALHARLPDLAVPEPIASGSWHGLTYSVSAALPSSTRRWSKSPESVAATLRRLCETGEVSRGRFAESAYSRSVDATLNDVARAEPEVAEALRALLQRLRHDTSELAFGRAHGDWVPWNLGTSDRCLHAWDWEHSRADAPFGLDLLHWHLQTTLARRRTTLGEAIAAVDRATPTLASLGIPPSSHNAVVTAYLLDLLVRNARLAAEGAGWNRLIRDGLADAVGRRMASTSA
jgi:hypothetical protein